MADAASKKTALTDWHTRHHAKMGAFNGWNMPLSYERVLSEHHHVRQKVGIFDVSHMGELLVTGPKALDFLQYLTINAADRLAIGEGQYTGLCYENGGMVDDLILYRTGSHDYFLCVNAGNTEKDRQWLQTHAQAFAGVEVRDVSSQWAQIAIQGPDSRAALSQLLTGKEQDKFLHLAYMHILETPVLGFACKLARTGYTGELGYELYTPPAGAMAIWQALIDLPSYEVKPIGLGARDTLRLEACYLLYGNDMNAEVSPLEAGIGWATRLEKGDFIGSQSLRQQKAKGLSRQMYGFLMSEPAIPRQHMPVFKGGQEIGVVTSGSVLPSLDAAGGLALLQAGKVQLGDEISIDVRGKHKTAKLVKRPFYQAKVKD